MSALTDLLERAALQRRATNAALGLVRDDEMLTRVEWRGQATDVRGLFYRIADGAWERRVAAAELLARLGWQQSEAQRILGLAGQASGQLCAALLGLDEVMLDLQPPGEWSVRQALEHHLNTEERYGVQVGYTLERYRAGGSLPEQVPEERMPARFSGQTMTGGPVDVVLDRLADARANTIADFSGLSGADLAVPARYGRQSVDVRYRLHRFAAHEREHTIQIVKTQQALGFAHTEAELILGQSEVASGGLEGALIGVPDSLIDQRIDGVTIIELLRRGIDEDGEAVQTIVAATR